jgi:hypothetical protein
MDLIASNSVEGFKTVQIPVLSIYYRLDEAALLDRKFRDSICSTLSDNGLLWPIIVKPIIENKYWCWLGNNRLHYAEQNGYNTISCIICEDYESRQKVHAITIMEYGKDF